MKHNTPGAMASNLIRATLDEWRQALSRVAAALDGAPGLTTSFNGRALVATSRRFRACLDLRLDPNALQLRPDIRLALRSHLDASLNGGGPSSALRALEEHLEGEARLLAAIRRAIAAEQVNGTWPDVVVLDGNQ